MAHRAVRVQEKGQVTLPRKIRERLGLKKGDLVTFVVTEGAVVVQPVEVVVRAAMGQIAGELKDRGVTLDDLIEQGRQIRGELLEKLYGLNDERP